MASLLKPAAGRPNFLAQIQTEVKPRPLAVAIFGAAGVGKTSTAAHADKPVVLCDLAERSIGVLAAAHAVPAGVGQLAVNHWEDAIGALTALAGGGHDFKTLIVDTLTGMDTLCQAAILQRDFSGSQKEFASYGKGMAAVGLEFPRFLAGIDAVRDAGMLVIALCHVAQVIIDPPDAPAYSQWAPALSKNVLTAVSRYVDAALHYTPIIAVDSDGKAKGGALRKFYTGGSPTSAAKNRLGLPATIDAGKTAAETWEILKKSLNLSADVPATTSK
jgi:hypothetical protein